MARVIVATVAYEGGFFSPDRTPSAPIRLYSDRWIEDDIIVKFGLTVKRQRLSRKDFRFVKRSARCNRAEGRV